MSRDNSRLPFTRELLRTGYTRQPPMHYRDPLIYEIKHGDRRLEVQLWKDGRHRVSHLLGGCMSTPPTPFKTIGEMHEACLHEATRTDHPPRDKVHPEIAAQQSTTQERGK